MSSKPVPPRLRPHIKVQYDLTWDGRPIGVITDKEKFIEMMKAITGVDLTWEDVTDGNE